MSINTTFVQEVETLGQRSFQILAKGVYEIGNDGDIFIQDPESSETTGILIKRQDPAAYLGKLLREEILKAETAETAEFEAETAELDVKTAEFEAETAELDVKIAEFEAEIAEFDDKTAEFKAKFAEFEAKFEAKFAEAKTVEFEAKTVEPLQ